MDPQTAEMVTSAIYVAGAVGATGFLGHSAARIVHNLTYVRRVRADAEREERKLRIWRELMDNPGYIQIMDRRRQLYEETLAKELEAYPNYDKIPYHLRNRTLRISEMAAMEKVNEMYPVPAP